MVESLKELNKLCQKPHYREKGNLMVRYFLRDAALPFTWLLLHTPVTANQVTTLCLMTGVVGILFFSLQPAGWFLAGAVLLQIWYLLDHVDGQIARYRKTEGLTGRYFDFVMHHVIHTILFFSLGVYAYLKTDHFFYVLWGFVTSLTITLFNLMHDTKHKTFIEKLMTLDKVEIISNGIASSPLAPRNDVIASEAKAGAPAPALNKNPLIVPSESDGAKQSRNLPRIFFSLLHKLAEIHIVMNLLTLAALLQVFIDPAWDFRFWFFIFYGISVPLLAIVKISYVISRRKIDEEFYSTFHSLDGK